MKTRTHLARRPARLALAVAAAALAACSDGNSPTVVEPILPPPASTVATLACTADVRAGTVSCADPDAPLGDGVRADRIVGGQNTYLKLASSNVAYDAASRIFAFDVTVQNLLVQRMGTEDGQTVSGIRVFFAGPPAATQGSGSIDVDNPDGEGVFTGSGQPYFTYAGTLGHLETSAPRRWRLSVPTSVTAFGFTLYVSTPLLPVVVYDKVENGNRDVWRASLDGSDRVRLTTEASDDRDPTVSQGTVVFVSYRDGNAELYAVPLAGGAATRLTTTTDNETEPALSPDGTRLAYTRAPSGAQTRLWWANADGTGAARATLSVASAIESGPAWMSSTRLAFSSTVDGSSDIFDLSVGGIPALREGGRGNEVEPAWSPDGTKIAFATTRDGDTELYLQDVSSGALTRLTTRAGIDGNPSWLKDGRIVYTCYQGTPAVTPRICWLDPAAPATVHQVDTGTGSTNRPAAVRF